jgi:hypothetical protein
MSFLPGMFPAAAAAAVSLTTIVQVLSATSTATTITVPADVRAGDLLVLLDRCNGIVLCTGDPPAAVVPSGFTTISNQATGNGVASPRRQIASYKLADGSEASTSLTGMTAASGGAKILAVFRGGIPIVSVVLNDVGGQTTDGNPTAQVVNASGGTPPLIVFGFYGSNSAIDPRTFSTTKDGELSQGNLWLAWKVYNSAPADTSIDMADEGNVNILQSCYITCA